MFNKKKINKKLKIKKKKKLLQLTFFTLTQKSLIKNYFKPQKTKSQKVKKTKKSNCQNTQNFSNGEMIWAL